MHDPGWDAAEWALLFEHPYFRSSGEDRIHDGDDQLGSQEAQLLKCGGGEPPSQAPRTA